MSGLQITRLNSISNFKNASPKVSRRIDSIPILIDDSRRIVVEEKPAAFEQINIGRLADWKAGAQPPGIRAQFRTAANLVGGQIGLHNIATKWLCQRNGLIKIQTVLAP